MKTICLGSVDLLGACFEFLWTVLQNFDTPTTQRTVERTEVEAKRKATHTHSAAAHSSMRIGMQIHTPPVEGDFWRTVEVAKICIR